MVANSLVLSNSSFVGSSAGASQLWQGGRSALAITANVYGGGVFLQMQGPDGSKWINVNGTTYSADQITAYDLPRGTYRVVSNTSSSVNIFATILSVPYA